MSAGRPLTIAPDVIGQINDWLNSASTYASPGDFAYKSLMRSAEKLANANSFASAISRAMLHHITGDLSESLHWIANMRKYPHEQMATLDTEVIVLSNLGYFARARSVFASSPAAPGLTEHILVMCGAFDMLLRRVEGTKIAETSTGAELIEIAKRCSMALDVLKLKESQLQAILEVVGEVLRAHRLLFADAKAPLIRTSHDGILYQMQLRVDATLAAQYTHEVVEKMVDRDLDVDGLYFSFIPA